MFQTEKEMLESAEIIKKFDLGITKDLAKNIGNKSIIFTGMGSSFLFPAKNAKNRAFALGIKNKVEAYFASELLSHNDFSDTCVFLCSNSGMTKETILLQQHLKKTNAKTVAVTALNDSILARGCKEKIILNCGFEKGVAATKSAIEQGLILDSLALNIAENQKLTSIEKIKEYQKDASKNIINNINLNISRNIIGTLSKADSIYYAGRATGVADEISLKTHEIARKGSFFYPATHIVHGIEESIESNPLIIFEPEKFRQFMGDFKRFSKRTKCRLFTIGEGLNNSIKIKSCRYFENYCLLAGGWGLLRSIANSLKLDIDKPKKAVKVGNPYKGK